MNDSPIRVPETAAPAPADDGQIPLRQRPIPERLDYFCDQLAAQMDTSKLPREAIVAMGAAILGMGAAATEVRALLADNARLRGLVEPGEENARG